MDSAATDQDLLQWWRPPEDDNEKRTGIRKLKAVHRTIRMRFAALERDLDAELEAAKVSTDQTLKDWRDTLIDLECEAVKRAMLNPDMLKSESIDDYTFMRDTTRIDGSLYLTRDEWASIGVTPPAPDETEGKAFTIDQTPDYAYSMYPVNGWATNGWDV